MKVNPEEIKKITFEKEKDVPTVPMSLGSMLVNETGTWKYVLPLYQNRTAPCNEACPAGEDIVRYMILLREGKMQEAYELLIQENPFPAVCGRVCYHPCEQACNRGDYDEAIGINKIEKAIGDFGLKLPLPEPAQEKKKEKIGIIGSGPAGLTCAYHLARMGYQVTVYEAMAEPGGILRLGIPEFRLPKDVLHKEIERIKALGVEIKSNTQVGKDISFDKLKEEYDAVFIATGAHHNRKLNVPGEETSGVLSGLEFLQEINLGKKPKIGPRVAIIGGGNTAMDAARCALRLGVQPIVYYRRTRQEMPALAEEIEDTLHEGIEIKFLTTPVKVLAENGKVAGMECVKMELGEPDSSGRRRPIPIDGSNYTVELETIIAAIGEQCDLYFLPKEILEDDWAIKIDDLGRTSNNKIFAGGDAADQPRTVAHAIGSGKRAAIAIDAYLQGIDLSDRMDKLRIGQKGTLAIQRYINPTKPPNSQVVTIDDINLDYFTPEPKGEPEVRSIKDYKDNFEEEKIGYNEDETVKEACRCFNCGTCNQCDNCFTVCPDVAIRRDHKSNRYRINYNYCKGCLVCVHECPRAAMTFKEVKK
jgi:NADPH-dependent glutamate synthase beta subunit-like oxidoreductase/Pyruvate/2-oxoacid:ferredoxin oxidoreductase delta subunit